MTNSQNNTQSNRGELILAYATVIVAVAAFLSLFAVLLAPLFGVDYAESTAWVWPVLLATAYVGFPVALLCLIALIIWRAISSRRENRIHGGD